MTEGYVKVEITFDSQAEYEYYMACFRFCCDSFPEVKKRGYDKKWMESINKSFPNIEAIDWI